MPDSRDYVNPTFTADHQWLHLEARYNYEALDTGSLWVGYNLSFGHSLLLDVTPMLGGVFGDLTGVAPGYELSLSWRRLSLSTLLLHLDGTQLLPCGLVPGRAGDSAHEALPH